MLAQDGKITLLLMPTSRSGPLLLWPKRKSPYPSRLLTANGGESVGNIGWGGRCHAAPLLVHRELGVPETRVEIWIRAIFRVKAQVLGTNVEIRRLAYGRETCVPNLFSCCARRATRLRKAERTGLWCRPNRMSLRRGRSGTVVEVRSPLLFFTGSTGRQCHIYRGGLVVL